MKLSNLIAIQTLRTRILAALEDPEPAVLPPAELVGQDNHPDVALLMRHFTSDHELECGLLAGYEIEFIGSIWAALHYNESYRPTAQESIVIQALNRKMAQCWDGSSQP